MPIHVRVLHSVLLGLVLLLAGCGAKQPRTAPQTPEVRTTAYEAADVWPQLNGLITARRVREGSIVRAGQMLYPP